MQSQQGALVSTKMHALLSSQAAHHAMTQPVMCTRLRRLLYYAVGSSLELPAPRGLSSFQSSQARCLSVSASPSLSFVRSLALWASARACASEALCAIAISRSACTFLTIIHLLTTIMKDYGSTYGSSAQSHIEKSSTSLSLMRNAWAAQFESSE